MMSISCRFRKSIRAMSFSSNPARGRPIARANATAAFYKRTRRRDRNTSNGLQGSAASQAAGRPGPGEVVAADRAERVEQLAAEEEAGMASALQGPRIDLVERNAAAGDLRLAEALLARPGRHVAAQPLDEREAILARQRRHPLIAGQAGLGDQLLRQAIRHRGPEPRHDETVAALQRHVPGGVVG